MHLQVLYFLIIVQCSTNLRLASESDIYSFSFIGMPCNMYKQKQSDLLLNADDLDAMWVCLRENCVIDDTTGAEKVSASFQFIMLILL